MEKFGLLNLIRALSGQAEQSGDSGGQTEDDDGQAAAQQNSSGHANILASVIERHEQISYRIKNKRNK